MLSFFDPPQLKAHRQAANKARSGRELAGREASIEVQMLAKRLAWGSSQRDIAYQQGQLDLAGALTNALGAGQELFDRLSYSIDPMVEETQDKWRSANTSARFEALTTHEHELRSLLIHLRDEARYHLGAIGVAGLAATTSSG